MKEQVKQNKRLQLEISKDQKFHKQETRFIMPNVSKHSESELKAQINSKDEKREKCLKGIFDFYCR